MLIQFPGIRLNLESVINTESHENSVILIHGFTGNSDDWSNITPSLNKKYNYYMVDLVGHGKSDSPEDLSFYRFDSLISQVKDIISKITDNNIVLAGYSLGGRIALNFAVKYPDKLNSLILESTSPGIIDQTLRDERIRQDEKLADFIEDNPIDKFVDFWMNIDLFKSQKSIPANIYKEIRDRKLLNNRKGLANSLRGSGAGRMEPLYYRLKEIPCKTLLITGELDSKFTTLSKEMTLPLPNTEHLIIPDAGHNIHLEKPAHYITAINKFLSVI